MQSTASDDAVFGQELLEEVDNLIDGYLVKLVSIQEQLVAELNQIDLETDKEMIKDGELLHKAEQSASLDDILLKP